MQRSPLEESFVAARSLTPHSRERKSLSAPTSPIMARGHQKVVYDLLFQASQQALQTLAADPRYVGGSLGMIGVLHRWARDLRSHPPVHYLIPGGGLTPDGSTWRATRHNSRLPETPLAQIFRAKCRALLTKAGLFDQVPRELWHPDWVVDVIAVGSGEAALTYLAPYVFRVAVSNRHLLALTDGQGTFRYRHSKTTMTQTTTLPAEQFIGRFLQHVLPRGFQKVRSYGLLHPKQRHRFAIVKGQVQSGSPQTVEESPHSPSSPPHISCRPADRKSTRLNSSHHSVSRMPSSA